MIQSKGYIYALYAAICQLAECVPAEPGIQSNILREQRQKVKTREQVNQAGDDAYLNIIRKDGFRESDQDRHFQKNIVVNQPKINNICDLYVSIRVSG